MPKKPDAACRFAVCGNRVARRSAACPACKAHLADIARVLAVLRKRENAREPYTPRVYQMFPDR